MSPEALNSAYVGLREQVVTGLRAAGVDPGSGASIAAGLGVNRQLAWQIATIAGESSPAAGLRALPGAKGLRLFVSAVERRAGDRPEVRTLRSAVDGLEASVRQHAGSRATLGLMAAAWSEDPDSAQHEAMRRQGYRAQCSLLGTDVATQVRGVVMGPSRSGNPSRLSRATYQCFEGLVRMRPNRGTRLVYWEVPVNDDGTNAIAPDDFARYARERFHPIEGISSGGVESLDVHVRDRRVTLSLRPGPVGQTGATTWAFVGAAEYESPRYRTERNTLNQSGIVIHVPTQELLLDFLIDRSLRGEIDLDALRLLCFDGLTGYPGSPANELEPSYLFEVTSRTPLDAMALRLDTRCVHTRELAERAAAGFGRTLDDLIGVRFRFRFAMPPMCFVFSRELPAPPG